VIPTMKMETRHPVEIYFGAIFRRPVIITEFWRPEVARTPKAKEKRLGVLTSLFGVWRAGE